MVVYNASASVPKGFYRVYPVKVLHRGDVVLMTTPANVRDLADKRRYLPKSVPMIKTVAALPGDEICAIGMTILINGHSIATRQTRDGQGRPLPQWQDCRSLQSGEFLPLNPNSPHSFDGRYFGAVSMALVRGRLEPM
ncbi:S26 family signal peptidase [Asticcacaulis sp. LKC15W]|uniref:S26 family signal peptidase n=2 Tax=Asticcacaulis machinosus TaxID=2984211 RepID=A0ABT5HFX8_9CAUL|nr:S26 family signal peptidase [Asticcacaulis machinosus]